MRRAFRDRAEYLGDPDFVPFVPRTRSDRIFEALVDEVENESPADKAGLKRGDVVRMINGKPCGNPNELRLRVAQALELARGNRTRAAKLLGMPYKAFLYRLEKYGLKQPA